MKGKSYVSFILLIILGISCVPTEPIIPNEEELITTLTLTLKPISGGDEVLLSFLDIDGDGGIQPQISSGFLIANTAYSGVISILNETTSPVTDITEEVNNEGTEHQFFYISSKSLNLKVDYDDADLFGNPVGINTVFKTSSSSKGTLTITLRHELNKDGSGVSKGDITNAGGETDIEVTFDVEIK